MEIFKKEIEFKIKNKLTPSQMFFIKCNYLNEWENFHKFLNETGYNYSCAEINDLYFKGLTEDKWNTHMSSSPDVVGLSVVCKNHLKDIYEEEFSIDDIDMSIGEEFYYTYPSSVTTDDGRVFTLKACNSFKYENKIYSGRNDVIRLYCKILNGDVEKHNRIIFAIKEAIKANAPNNSTGKCVHIKTKITTFLTNHAWEDLFNFLDNPDNSYYYNNNLN